MLIKSEQINQSYNVHNHIFILSFCRTCQMPFRAFMEQHWLATNKQLLLSPRPIQDFVADFKLTVKYVNLNQP